MAETGADIYRAAELLSRGEVVAIPTETVYGLAANALNPAAVLKIFEIKNRPAFDPLIVHVPEIDHFDRYAKDIPESARKLAEAVCPGPVTFILPKKAIVPDLVTSGHDTVGLRIPDHPLALKLLNHLSFPLAAPSANPFGYVSPTTAQHVADQLGDSIPYILDGGACRVGLESTIVDFSQEPPVVLRLGGMQLEELEHLMGARLGTRISSSNPKAPGMLIAHYSPGKPVFLGQLADLAQEYNHLKVGVLAFQHELEGVPTQYQRILSPSGDLSEAARNLFQFLRDFNSMPVDCILAEFVPDNHLGRAINDRLRRAAASKKQ
jgi:L-threonylcarbamoyladenylate synthase